MNIIRFTFCILLTTLALAMGCATSTPLQNPITGWKFCYSQDPIHSNKIVLDDYQDYIQKLPPNERVRVIESNISLFKDSTGQHAVKISIPLQGFWSGVWWDHILIYDVNSKRIKTIKHKSGRYMS